MPLLRDDQIAPGNLKEIQALYVDDDSVRRRYIEGFNSYWVIPKRSHQAYNELIEALRNLLGPEKVQRVSEYAIDVRFKPLEEGVLLLQYLRTAFPGLPIAEDLALLIVKGGAQATSPREATFRHAWGRIRDTRVIRGSFEVDAARNSCFDAKYLGGPALLVSSRLSAHEIVGAMWQAVGPSYIHIWAAYAVALRDGQTEQFFNTLTVSPADRTEVETEIGLGFDKVLLRYQPVCLALWSRANTSRAIADFHAEWAKEARTPETGRAWLGCEDLEAEIQLAVRMDEPAGSLSLLSRFKLSIREWQDARRALGVPAARFAQSEQRYKSALSAVSGHIMAWFSYLVVPRASGESRPTVAGEFANTVFTWVKELGELAVPEEVAEDVFDGSIITARVAADALRIAADHPDWKLPLILTEPIAELAKSAPNELTSIKLRDEPDKSATTYELVDEVTRGQQAAAAVETILKIASALAMKQEEMVDSAKERAHSLVVLLMHGHWANRIAVLAAVRFSLESSAPKTATRMKERQAFRDVEDWRTLWQKFEELGDIPKPTVAPLPKQTFQILGTGWTEEEFHASAAEGPAGELVRRLETAVISDLDLLALRLVDREPVPVKVTRTGSRVGGGGGGSKRRPPDAYLGMLGALGEHFVYQQLRVVFPDLDITNWRSKAKELFGYGAGDDSLGYDFEYHDPTGKLTGTPLSPRCLIEVKSNAQDGSDTFEITTNEWETAVRCHSGVEKAIYVVIRVDRTASEPRVVDILVDPIQLHLDGLLDYSSRDLLVAVGKRKIIT